MPQTFTLSQPAKAHEFYRFDFYRLREPLLKEPAEVHASWPETFFFDDELFCFSQINSHSFINSPFCCHSKKVS